MKYQHTIRLTIDDDGVRVQRSRELWSMYISPARLLIIVVNLAALVLSLRCIYNTAALDFSYGIYSISNALFARILPIGEYAPG